jgi:protein-tyrosine sulfotransferase
MNTAPILILSQPRTGSTLLRYLLDTHPDICSPAELQIGLLCGALTNAMELTLGEASLTRDTYKVRTQCFTEVRGILDRILAAYCLAKGKVRWCEKSPSNLQYLDYLNGVFPDARCICLHRHGLDVVKSSIATGIAGQLGPAMGGHSAEVPKLVHHWCSLTERLLAFETAYSSRVLRVRYEDLTTDPVTSLAAIWNFVGVNAVADLHISAFNVRHDDGPGDANIAGSVCVEGDHIGRGLDLKVSEVSLELRTRMWRLLEILNY